ncbi:MAG: HAD family phosphatase [Acidimicrobiales bacterium]|nr:MAG: HAD family phosphatase [Acidimicrobiales bacterium]
MPVPRCTARTTFQPHTSTDSMAEPQPPIRAVVFDFGGVLITSISSQLSEIAATHGVDTAVMHELLLGPRASGPDHPWHRAERGEIPTSEIQELLEPWADEQGVRLSGDEIDRLLAPGGYTVIDSMADRIRRLREDGYLTGLLTNTFAEFQPTMQRDIDFALFDVVVESFAVGARKPERVIYEIAAEMLDVDHDQIVYLDDFDQNLDEPIALGWTTILVGDHDEALRELDDLLAR